MSAILPRLFLAIFRYSQAIIINLTIRYVSKDVTRGSVSETGYWLVIAALIVYGGMAVSIAVFLSLICTKTSRFLQRYINIS